MVYWIYVAQQISIYVGFAFFILGLFGSIMLIIIFSKDRQYRNTPCTFYFLIASIHDLLLMFILGLRIITVGFAIDLTKMSFVWCKLRFYFFCTWAGILLTCQCLATCDQYLVTSKSVRLRSFSSMNNAYRAVIVTMVFWWLQTIPWLIYQDIVNGTCGYTSEMFLRYVVFFGLFGLSWIHSLLLIIFGMLAYRNMVNSIALSQQYAHRQMTMMVCIQVFPVVLSGILNGGWNVYALATYDMVKSLDRLYQEYLFNSSVALLAYLGSAIRFYLFFFVSSRFRQAIKNHILFCRIYNRINPSVTPNLIAQSVQNK